MPEGIPPNDLGEILKKDKPESGLKDTIKDKGAEEIKLFKDYSEEIDSRLTNLTAKLTTHIISACCALRKQTLIIAAACLVVVVFGIFLGCNLYNDTNYPKDWGWQMLYFTTARIIVVTGFFYLVNFCFRLLKSYLFLYQRNRHRLFVVNSMSNLIASSKDDDRKEVHLKLLNIITDFDDAGIIKEEKIIDSEAISTIEKIFKIIKDGTGK